MAPRASGRRRHLELGRAGSNGEREAAAIFPRAYLKARPRLFPRRRRGAASRPSVGRRNREGRTRGLWGRAEFGDAPSFGARCRYRRHDRHRHRGQGRHRHRGRHGGPGPPRCPRHGEPLRLYCVQDRRAVCVVCHLSREHRAHTVLPAEEAAHAAEEVPQEHLSSLRKGREEAKAERERQSEELLKQTEVERQKIVAECKELRAFLEEKEQLLLSRLEELERDIGRRRDESVARLAEDIAQLDKLLAEQGGGDSGTGSTPGEGVVPVGSSLESWMFLKPEPGFSELEKKLKSFSQKSAVLKEVLLEFKENLRFELENDTGELSLDPDTANPYLVLSEDKRSVRLRGAPQELPAHPKRFDYAFCVLASEGFSAGRHYWEVEVGDGESWVLGAARESVRRKEKVDFAPEEGIWAVGLNWKGKNWDQYQAFTSPETPLSLCERPRKIGVYLDYEGGWVAFYNADNMAPIFTFTAAFSERIFPFFWLFYVGSSLSLCN
ncbi:E3 ubiquitin-protein ligase TRIM7-like [Onychostruthus taczanowskii]|uniref:E3 ubiquitin-protein ligase TRIM7-like n=1 Tax=Onychostruthus taczanowskii TaxID=356909 RepID=UPI001B80724E|nr:E3 ubiquitin-protein ligase TRIM7-like [Onychostruthus taczanowskii]